MDVSQVNTDAKLAAILTEVEGEINSTLDPDNMKTLGDRANQIRTRIVNEEKRHESEIEARANEIKSLDKAVTNAPKRNVVGA